MLCEWILRIWRGVMWTFLQFGKLTDNICSPPAFSPSLWMHLIFIGWNRTWQVFRYHSSISDYFWLMSLLKWRHTKLVSEGHFWSYQMIAGHCLTDGFWSVDSSLCICVSLCTCCLVVTEHVTALIEPELKQRSTLSNHWAGFHFEVTWWQVVWMWKLFMGGKKLGSEMFLKLEIWPWLFIVLSA